MSTASCIVVDISFSLSYDNPKQKEKKQIRRLFIEILELAQEIINGKKGRQVGMRRWNFWNGRDVGGAIRYGY